MASAFYENNLSELDGLRGFYLSWDDLASLKIATGLCIKHSPDESETSRTDEVVRLPLLPTDFRNGHLVSQKQ